MMQGWGVRPNASWPHPFSLQFPPDSRSLPRRCILSGPGNPVQGHPIMRCAIYTRVSTEEQTRPEYNSIQSQQDICRHYVEVQWENAWDVNGIHEDGGPQEGPEPTGSPAAPSRCVVRTGRRRRRLPARPHLSLITG